MLIFEQYKPEIVVNLGAQAGVRYSITNPDAYVEANLIGFYNILEACRHSYDEGHTPVEHLVYASSSSVYGSNKKVPYSTDDKVDNPVSLYAATKKSNELMAHAYSMKAIRWLLKLVLVMITLPLILAVWLAKWFVVFLHHCSAWFFYLLGSVLLVTAMLSFLMQQSQGMEALQMLIGGFVIFMIPQVVGSVIVLLELAAVMLRQAWYI